MKRIYFNPNWHPSYFYRLIKPLAVIYDEILIWSPVGKELEEAFFPLGDFLQACKPTAGEPPVIIPSARDSWFDADFRRSHPAPECRNFDPLFENGVQEAAQKSGTILPTSDLATGYRVVDELWNSEEGRTRIGIMANEVGTKLPSSMMVRVEDVAEKASRPLPWAVANVFAQDVVAIHRLGAVAPLVRIDYARGYLCLAPSAGEETLRRRIVLRQELPDLPTGIKAADILKFLDDAYATSSMPWAEVAKLRKSSGKKIRRWLNQALAHQRRPLSASTISEIADIRAHALHRAAEKQLESAAKMAMLPLTILLEALGVNSREVNPIIQLLRAFRLETPLVRFFAGVGLSVDRLLVDTPFFVEAELGSTEERHGGKGS